MASRLALICFGYALLLLLVALAANVLPLDEGTRVTYSLYCGLLLIYTGPIAVIVGIVCVIRLRSSRRMKESRDDEAAR